MGKIEDLKKELAKQQEVDKLKPLIDEATRRIKEYCALDKKKAGYAFTDKEILSNVIVPMISKETNNSDDVYAAIKTVFEEAVSLGYFVERESDKTLLLTGAGCLWIGK